jgi:hypothetical protein
MIAMASMIAVVVLFAQSNALKRLEFHCDDFISLLFNLK